MSAPKGLDDFIRVCYLALRFKTYRLKHPQRQTILDLIRHLHVHSNYPAIFESYYLTITSEFYAAESNQKAETSNADEFLNHCDSRTKEEVTRSRNVLPERSRLLVQQATERGLLSERRIWVAKEGT